MYRLKMSDLIDWKEKPNRKPLVLNGARQVGKTWLLKEFGRLHFENVAYISLDNNEIANNLFQADFDVSRIIKGLGLLCDLEIHKDNTLIILDEIQSSPRALTSLKYFCEEKPEYHICAAGSLLGLLDHTGSGYPVGKVDTLDLFPLSFKEFLMNCGNGELANLIDNFEEGMLKSFAPKMHEELKLYCIVGGMPAAVSCYIKSGSLAAVRTIQHQLLQDYPRDFTKHCGSRSAIRILEVWDSLVSQLSTENKKFVFGQIKTGARGKDYEEALAWLERSGLIRRVYRIKAPRHPISAYEDKSAFKVFMIDVGLFCAKSEIDPSIILEENKIFNEFKGCIAEQYVCQELVNLGINPYYWSAKNSSGELDFIVQANGKIYPIEVKAEENLKAKSLRSFVEKHSELRGVRFSMANYRRQEWMTNVPLYAISNVDIW